MKTAAPSPVFRNGTRQNETLSCVSIEDAGRVEDPTLCVRPCKTIVDGRSLVLTGSNKIVPQRGTST